MTKYPIWKSSTHNNLGQNIHGTLIFIIINGTPEQTIIGENRGGIFINININVNSVAFLGNYSFEKHSSSEHLAIQNNYSVTLLQNQVLFYNF